MRLFAALPLPGPVADHLAAALVTVRDNSGPLVRFSPRENWHITLSFYGEQPEGAIEDLVAHLARAASIPAPVLELAGAGAFQHRHLYVGVHGGTALEGLMSAAALGEPESPHRPHVTIAKTRNRDRFGEAKLVAGDIISALAVYRGPAWQPDAVTLFLSELGKGRSGHPLYTPLETIPFAW